MKNHVLGEMGNWGHFGAKLHTSFSQDPLRNFFKLCTITGYNERTKMTCLTFPKIIPIVGQIGNLGPFGAKLCISIFRDPR